MKKIKIGVVGSRTFNDYQLLKSTLDPLKDVICLIVSGGAKGADSLAEQWAKENGVPTTIFVPDWDLYGKSAGYRRNVQIVEEADHILAFWDKKSKGTKHSIDLARKLKKKCSVISF